MELATLTNSNVVDLFGPTVNICSKINQLAMPNKMIIYKDLYDVIKVTLFSKTIHLKQYVKVIPMIFIVLIQAPSVLSIVLITLNGK